MVWAGDINRHHQLWDENRNSHLFTHENLTNAQILIDLQIRYDMRQILPKGIPTLIATNTGNYTRPDNMFVSESLVNNVPTCTTIPALRPVKTDHIPIQTIIKTRVQIEQQKPRRNYVKTDWPMFEWKLKYRLHRTPPPAEITGKQEMIVHLDQLTKVITDTVDEHVPLNKPYPNKKRWWTLECIKARKKINTLSNLAHRKHFHMLHSAHKELKQYRRQYAQLIEETKNKHWIKFITNTTDTSIWTIYRYISNQATDGGRSQIPTLYSGDMDEQIEAHETNESKSKVLHQTII